MSLYYPHSAATLGTQPSLYFNEEGKTTEEIEKWYKQHAQFIAGRYNHSLPYFGIKDTKGGTTRRWVTDVYKWLTYSLAKQGEGAYDFFARSEENIDLHTTLINDKTIRKLVKHIEGNLAEMVENLPDFVSAKGVSNEIIRSKESKMNMAKMFIDMEYVFNTFKELGLEVENPVQGQYNSEEELIKYGEETLQEAIEVIMTDAARDFLYKNDWRSFFQLVASYLIPAWFSRVEIFADRGDIKVKVHRPTQCIWDNSVDDIYGRKARFWGTVESLTVPELFKAYDFTDEEKEEVEKLAKNESLPFSYDGLSGYYGVNDLNNMYGVTDLLWWNQTNSVNTVTVVKATWKAWEKMANGKDGETLYQCVLIGNKYIKKFGKRKNLVESKTNKSDILPPYIDFIPDMQYGFNVGIIEGIFELADRIRGLQAKKDLLINRAKGRVPYIVADRLPAGTNAQTLTRDISITGVVVINEADIDDFNQESSRRIMGTLDITGDVQTISVITQDIELLKMYMEDAVSIPKMVQGGQTGVHGAREINQTIKQAMYGMKGFYEGWRGYVNNIVGYAADLFKLINTKDNEKEVKVFTGKLTSRQMKILKLVKEYSLSDIQIYFDNNDVVTQADRQRYEEMGFAALQSGQGWFDPLILARIQTMKSNSEIINYLESEKKKWVMQQAIQQQQQMEMQMAQQQAQQEAQENMVAAQVQGAQQQTQLKAEADLAKQQMKGDQEIAQQFLAEGEQPPVQ